ncbi:hypothetical protein ACWDBC_11440 [Streptomyces parvus]
MVASTSWNTDRRLSISADRSGWPAVRLTAAVSLSGGPPSLPGGLVVFPSQRALQECFLHLRTTALHLAVLRAMADHGLKKVLVYFNLTSDARLFARELPHTLRRVACTDPHLVPATLPETLFVHGEAPSSARRPSSTSPEPPP